MNNRLNKIYGEIYDIEDQIIDCERRKVATTPKILTIENMYKIVKFTLSIIKKTLTKLYYLVE